MADAFEMNPRPDLSKLPRLIVTIEKWDGKLPQVSGGATPFIDINT